MKKTNRGFTLVELLVVIVIIGVIAGTLYLSMAPMDDKAREQVCYHNRSAIARALGTYRLLEGYSKDSYSLNVFIGNKFEDTISNKNAECPSGGKYSASFDVTGREFVACSKHPKTSGGDDPGEDTPNNMIPGTNIGIGGGTVIFATDDWESIVEKKPSWGWDGDIKSNNKFFYENEYYVAVQDIVI